MQIASSKAWDFKFHLLSVREDVWLKIVRDPCLLAYSNAEAPDEPIPALPYTRNGTTPHPSVLPDARFAGAAFLAHSPPCTYMMPVRCSWRSAYSARRRRGRRNSRPIASEGTRKAARRAMPEKNASPPRPATHSRRTPTA